MTRLTEKRNAREEGKLKEEVRDGKGGPKKRLKNRVLPRLSGKKSTKGDFTGPKKKETCFAKSIKGIQEKRP